MNQLCNYIDLVPLTDVDHIENSTVFLKAGKTYDRITSEVSPTWTENPSRSDAGTLFDQNLRIVSDKLSEPLKTKYPVNLPVVAVIYDDEGNHVIGNFDQLARITIIPNPHTDSVQIARKTTEAIY